MACRPATLVAAVVPVAVGTACAAAVDAVHWLAACAALVGALLIQIGTNFANDAFDFESGADTQDRLGPPRAAQLGLLTPHQLRIGMAIVFAIAIVVGIYLTTRAGWPIVAIGLASIVCGIAYTGGPYPLGYNGLGDVFVIVFFGFVAVCGTAFVQSGAIPAIAWWAAVPVGALATAILCVNNLRDRTTDAAVGKRTLAVRLGARAVRLEYVLMCVASYVVATVLAAREDATLWTLAPFLTLPFAVVNIVALYRATTGDHYNRLLKRTALLLCLFGAALTLAVAGA